MDGAYFGWTNLTDQSKHDNIDNINLSMMRYSSESSDSGIYSCMRIEREIPDILLTKVDITTSRMMLFVANSLKNILWIYLVHISQQKQSSSYQRRLFISGLFFFFFAWSHSQAL